jgi:hypothetical protein
MRKGIDKRQTESPKKSTRKPNLLPLQPMRQSIYFFANNRHACKISRMSRMRGKGETSSQNEQGEGSKGEGQRWGNKQKSMLAGGRKSRNGDRKLGERESKWEY